MAYLQKGIEIGTSMRLNQTAGYKLIATLAQFHPDYRAIDEVTLDSKTLEASTTISFGQVKSTGSFSTHPAYIDAMTQTAGFVMNGKDDTDLDVEIYVNHGWESLQIYTEILPGKSYQTYVQMVKGEGGLYYGDTVMFDGEEIVAFFKGVAVSGCTPDRRVKY
jgi:iterative type I PKS product template protein